MKIQYPVLSALVALAMLTGAPRATAQLIIPSDGSDGALLITESTNIDLSLATTGAWNTNNAANAGNGVYDPAQWAVVFKYSSVIIQGGATVTFINHPSRAPVVWLVSGDVLINGTVSLNGGDWVYRPQLAEPGPGGFRGGVGNIGGGAYYSSGFGPGADPLNYNGGAIYGPTVGFAGPAVPYGNPSLIPLIGGSGGYGWSQSGPGGGGAILIACANSLSVNGTIQSDGGNNYDNNSGSSGGAVRLVANVLSGGGTLECYGGPGDGGLGRIRIERVTDTSSLQIVPDPSVLPLTNSATPILWMPSTGPSVAIETVNGLPAADPRASFGARGADVTLPLVTATTVTVLTTNVEPESVVKIRCNPRSSGNFSDTIASVYQTVSQNPTVIRWSANVPVTSGYYALQVHVIRP